MVNEKDLMAALNAALATWDVKSLTQEHIAAVLERRKVPQRFQSGLILYFAEGLAPGLFMRAVLRLDMLAAWQAADSLETWTELNTILGFLYWEVPDVTWGSAAKCEAWINGRTVRTTRPG